MTEQTKLEVRCIKCNLMDLTMWKCNCCKKVFCDECGKEHQEKRFGFWTTGIGAKYLKHKETVTFEMLGMFQ